MQNKSCSWIPARIKLHLNPIHHLQKQLGRHRLSLRVYRHSRSVASLSNFLEEATRHVGDYLVGQFLELLLQGRTYKGWNVSCLNEYFSRNCLKALFNHISVWALRVSLSFPFMLRKTA